MGKRGYTLNSRTEGSISGPETVQGPVSKSDCLGSCRQLYSGSLHKQTGRNPLHGDVCSAVENHDLVPSLRHSPMSQAHSRVPKCDGRLTVQVKSDPINRMVPASAGIQTDLSEVV